MNDMEARSAATTQQLLSSGELKTMLGQCLKMASENKITAHNTWGLPLIEHLDDLIRDDRDSTGKSTNFQKASVTLDAGVKIYSYRVDSVHTETFKMLGGLGRAAGPEEEGTDGSNGQDGGGSPSKRKRKTVDLNPETTLESSLEALNVKKFDLTFAVDPLFHKTSAQFDEGGAKGLLLNNLSVYNGCNIVFDSMDVPDTTMDQIHPNSDDPSSETSACIRGDVSQMIAAVEAVSCSATRIAPALDDIVDCQQGSREIYDALIEESIDCEPPEPASFVDTQDISMSEQNTELGVQDENLDAALHADIQDSGYDEYGGQYDEYGGQYDDHAGVGVELGEDAIHWLVHAGSTKDAHQSGNLRGMAWAGASHWRYGKTTANGIQRPGVKEPFQKAAKSTVEPFDFVDLLSSDDPVIEVEKRPKRQKKKSAVKPDPIESKTLLPDDYKYSVDRLGRYMLRPDYISILQPKERGGAVRYGFGADNNDAFGDWGSAEDGQDLGWDASLSGDLELAEASHKVEKVEVSYSKAAKQVDVKQLKELMWQGIQRVIKSKHHQEAGTPHDPIEFADIIATVPRENPAGSLEDLSVHLCFICVLHLANEHGLVVTGFPTMDRLTVSNA